LWCDHYYGAIDHQRGRCGAGCRTALGKRFLGKNPRTGATVEVSPKVIPCFRTGMHLHARLNDES
jgi:hypothetical protein